MNIYVIINKETQEKYVGQTKLNIYERWGRHILDAYRADRGVANNQRSDFHSALVKYTPEAFMIELLETCDEKDADEKEKYWITKLDTYNNGYNMTIGGQDYFKTNNSVYKRYGKTGDYVEDICNDLQRKEELNFYENDWSWL